MPIDFTRTRERLKDFDFHRLFVEELGWSQPSTKVPTEMKVNDAIFTRRQISQLAGIAVFEITSQEGGIPDSKSRAAIHKEVSAIHHENLLIFVDKERAQSLWYWVKREGTRKYPREHFYLKGQPGDLFLGKLSDIVFELSEFDENGNISVIEVAKRLRGALDVERVTKRFYAEFQDQHIAFLELIRGIPDNRERRWYASVLLNRLMFIYFLQRKGFIDKGDLNYLQNRLALSRERGRDLFYSSFLKLLFFEGFAKPEDKRSAEANRILGQIKYLNGGLFLPHQVEQENPDISVPDKAFDNLFSLFQRYSWNLNDTPGGQDNEINPDVLGYIFEKYINQKAFGAYYTRTEITEYLCERTIHRLILDAINTPEIAKKHPIKGVKVRDYSNIAELLLDLDAAMCRELLFTVLPNLSLLDPACGSGAFLVAAMKTLINVYAAVIGKIKFLNDANLNDWLNRAERDHKSLGYFIKKIIITDNLYGVDIMEEATEIARLRLFLALVAAADNVDQLEPLPNIDFNILSGNSLIGLMRVDDADFEKRTAQGKLFQPSYSELLKEKNRLIDLYRHTATYAQDLTALRNDIQQKKDDALATLNEILLSEFKTLGIRYEQATWDVKKGEQSKPVVRSVTIKDVEQQHPFHWGYEFDKVLHERGGFDAIITNPPWEIFKPIAKEFCYEFDPDIERRGTEIGDFEERLAKLLRSSSIREKYLEYCSQFPHMSDYFRSTPQYANQISVVNGKKAGTDINLYKLFVEQCFNLLREGGYCGIVVPSGIYSDLGTKQLREMLFHRSTLTGLFCFENRKQIFEGVDSRFKFVVLTFEKGGKTDSFPAAFMRHDVSDLNGFPQQNSIAINVDLLRRLSPDSLSVMEFKSPLDIEIANKMVKFPLLGEAQQATWNVRLTAEFHMTNDSGVFKSQAGDHRLPLYEGKMIWLFEHGKADVRYWVSEKDAIKKLMSPRLKAIDKLLSEHGVRDEIDPTLPSPGFRHYRMGFRAVTGATNERALVVSVVPRNVVAGNSLILSVPTIDTVRDGKYAEEKAYSGPELLACTAIMGSFLCDWFVRQKILTNMNMFYVYQLPIPRITDSHPMFKSVVTRAAQLICTSPEFDDLAKQVGLKNHKDGIADPTKRVRIRAELDALVAHLYGVSEEDFAHVLRTFPLVDQQSKDATLAAYKEFAPKSSDQQLQALIASGESGVLEFKSSARWDLKENKASKAMEQVIVKTAAGFLNVESGGTLLIGLQDNGKVLGLEDDYKTMGQRANKDGYENWLTNLLLGEFGKDSSPLIRMTFHNMDGKDVCQLVFKPSPRPVFVKDSNNEHLYIRTGNSTRLLTSREAVEYCRQRWP